MYSGFFVFFWSNSLLSGNFPKKMQSGVRIHTVRIHTQRDGQRRIRPMCIAQLGVLIDNICLYITNRVCQKPWTSADVCVVRSKSHAFSLEFMFSKNDIYIYIHVHILVIFFNINTLKRYTVHKLFHLQYLQQTSRTQQRTSTLKKGSKWIFRCLI